jgi:lipopolysaccharide export system permease protein
LIFNIIDRYILKQFIATLFFALFALCVIFLIVNLIENLDEFLDQNAKMEVIVSYYLSFFPEILKNLTPVATLLATLFTIGRLSMNNEITAMKSGSMSLYRLMLPLVIVTSLLSVGQLFFNGWVVPRANTKKLDIESQYLSKGRAGSIHNLYFRDNPFRNINMQYYDADKKTGNRVTIEDFNSETEPRLVERIEARQMVWDSLKNRWNLIDGLKRTFGKANAQLVKFDTMNISIRITHNQIIKLKLSVEEMNFDELMEYIQMLNTGGKNVTKQLIEYYGNYAFPFANLIVVLFGVPFASVRKKSGIAMQITAAMVVSFLYLVFTKISQTLGYSMNLEPELAGWSANILFILIGIFVMLKTKT